MSHDHERLVPQQLTQSVGGTQGRLEGIIRCATEAIITIDESQTILIFNPMAEKLFGCPAHEAIGSSLARFIPERYRHSHAQQVKQFGVTGISERQMGRKMPLFGLRANGQEFPIEASISQLVDENGRLYTVMLRDITDRLKAEASLTASRNELRQLSANIQTAREEEKARIARELHDDLGQRLTALKMDLSLLESELEESVLKRDFAWRERTQAMQRLIDETVHAVRSIAADLRPVMLDDLGLMAAIEWLANEWRRRYGIVVRLDAGNEIHADVWNGNPTAATAIFRIVQEALTNIARHANATRALVVLRLDQATATVLIEDNGVGMGRALLQPYSDLDQEAGSEAEAEAEPGSARAASDPRTTSHDRQPFGLIGMRERASLLGGEVTLSRPANGGCAVTVTIPIASLARVPEGSV